jgi:hypothetical protein
MKFWPVRVVAINLVQLGIVLIAEATVSLKAAAYAGLSLLTLRPHLDAVDSAGFSALCAAPRCAAIRVGPVWQLAAEGELA